MRATRPHSKPAGLSCTLLAAWLSLPAAAAGLPEPPESYFGAFGYCALVLGRNRYREVFVEAGPEQCRKPLSPCSTFKIPNALIGLQTGVVSGPDDNKKWDGTPHGRAVANGDQTLRSAIALSIPWYFQELAREVGAARMTSWLETLNYGNRDISAGIDRFWLGSSLKINGYQQLDLIRDLWRGSLPFDPGYQAQVRAMLIQESALDGALHGKTGSCPGDADPDTPGHGWFIGWVDWNPRGRNSPQTIFLSSTSPAPTPGARRRRESRWRYCRICKRASLRRHQRSKPWRI